MKWNHVIWEKEGKGKIFQDFSFPLPELFVGFVFFNYPCAIKYLLLLNKITWNISPSWQMVELVKLMNL